jgi:hypothetical protein
MGLVALRDPTTKTMVRWQVIALDERDRAEGVAENPRGQDATDAPAEHDRVPE